MTLQICRLFCQSTQNIFANKRNERLETISNIRYGKDKLKYEFKLADGEYLVELYFIEPWLGIGGGVNAKAMRLFDVAINDKVVLNDIDIWSEVGTNTILKKEVKVKILRGKMIISFRSRKLAKR
jgi:phosphatidate phosphatase PAH1